MPATAASSVIEGDHLSAPGRIVLGSAADRLLHGTTCPVVGARPVSPSACAASNR